MPDPAKEATAEQAEVWRRRLPPEAAELLAKMEAEPEATLPGAFAVAWLLAFEKGFVQGVHRGRREGLADGWYLGRRALAFNDPDVWQKLSPEQQRVVTVICGEKQSYALAADTLSVTEDTISYHMRQAAEALGCADVKALRDRLEAAWRPPEDAYRDA